MTDLRDRDPKIRELVLRIVDQAPDPAPFPVGAVPPRVPRRRGRMLLAAACVMLLAIVGAVLAVISSPSKKPHISTSESTAPAAVDPLQGKQLPQQGLAVIAGNRMTLRADDGHEIATVPVAKLGNDVLNDPWNVQLFVTSTGVRVVHLPLTSRTGVPSGCTVPTATAEAANIAECGPRNGDQLLGDHIAVDQGGWRTVITKPPVPNGASVVDGHWEWAARSPDGKWVIAQWSGECETQTAFVISVSDGSVHAVTGEAGSAWGDAPESTVLGWTSSGHAVAEFGGGDTGCGGASALPHGVYVVSPTNLSRRLLVPLPTTSSLLRWTTVDDRRVSEVSSPPSTATAVASRPSVETVSPNLNPARLWTEQYGMFVNTCGTAVAVLGDRIYGVSGTTNGGIGGSLPWCSKSWRDGSTNTRSIAANTIVVGGDGVYFVGAVNGRSYVERVDPVTLAPKWRRDWPASDSTKLKLAASATTDWVGVGNQLQRLDPSNGAVLSSLTTATPVEPAIDDGGTHLYTLSNDPNGGVLDRRDATTGAVLRSGAGPIRIDSSDAQMVATSNGVWISYRTGSLGTATFYDASSLHRGASLVPPGEHTEFGYGVTVAFGKGVLIAEGQDQAGSQVLCGDPVTGAWRHALTLPAGGAIGLATDGGNVMVAFDKGAAILHQATLCTG
jgi:hypothetical protein